MSKTTMTGGEALQLCVDERKKIRCLDWDDDFYIYFDGTNFRSPKGNKVDVSWYSLGNDNWEVYTPKEKKTLWVVGEVNRYGGEYLFEVLGTYETKEDAEKMINKKDGEQGPFPIEVEVDA